LTHKRRSLRITSVPCSFFPLGPETPHLGQVGALSETEDPHSIQFTSAMVKILSGRDVGGPIFLTAKQFLFSQSKFRIV
jgi:hypothetical protein